MQSRWIAAVFLRELDALTHELDTYPTDADLWRVVPGVSNAAGTLALHLAGNLRHFVGGVLGGTGYERDRNAEFATRDVSKSALLAEMALARRDVAVALEGLDEDALRQDYPTPVGKFTVTTGEFLIHLVSHLAYHLGQVDYHRRFLTGTGAVPGVIALAALSTARETA